MEEKKINQSLEKALSFMENDENLTEEDLRMMMEDEECLQACKDLLDCKSAIELEHSRNIPNVDREWAKFQSKTRDRSKRRWLMVGGMTGMVASILLVFLFSWLKGDLNPWEDNITVFQATNQVQQVTLQTASGGKFLLDGNTQSSQLTNLGAQFLKKGKKELVYDRDDKRIQTDMHILSTPRGHDFKVELADGTVIWLNAESRLEYPSRFTGKERVVHLQGEAYFEVAKDKERPFIIRTNNLQTRVLGTEFNIRNYSAHDSHVTLIRGSVEVRNALGGPYARITPGVDAHLQEDGSFALEEVDTDSYVYWKEGFFYFDNVSLINIVQNLGRWYNVNVVFNNKAAMDYKMHYLCDRKGGLEHAITLLNRMKKVKVELEGNTIFIR